MFGHAAAMVYDMNNQGGPISALSGALGITSSDGGEVFISFAVLSLAFGLLPRYEYDSARDRWVWSWTNEPASASKRGTTKGNEGDAVLAGAGEPACTRGARRGATQRADAVRCGSAR